MKMYTVTICERIKREVPIKAKSKENAMDIVQMLYYNNEIVLNDVNSEPVGVIFEVRENEKDK